MRIIVFAFSRSGESANALHTSKCGSRSALLGLIVAYADVIAGNDLPEGRVSETVGQPVITC